MKIKKYEGKSEQEVLEAIRDDLGLSAIILSIKRKHRRGLLHFLSKPLVIITAAHEDGKASDEGSARSFGDGRATHVPTDQAGTAQKAEQQQRIASLEDKLTNTEDLLSRVVEQLNIAEQIVRISQGRRYESNLVQLFYDSLIEQGVSQEIAEKLLEPIDSIDEQDKVNINLIVKIIYNKIIGILGSPKEIGTDTGGQICAFIGPTGVGKTTTIAKLSSSMMLGHGKQVGLITADTYRIAAVEQLKIYADILGIDIQVVYNRTDLVNCISDMQPKHDIVFIDTAGRSHKNSENILDLNDMLSVSPDCRKYLVLSATTKGDDLAQIINTYSLSLMADFDLIFTKLDETGCLGVILNACFQTGKHVAYVTYGQNVPDDIEAVQPEKIAKALLGLGW